MKKTSYLFAALILLSCVDNQIPDNCNSILNQKASKYLSNVNDICAKAKELDSKNISVYFFFDSPLPSQTERFKIHSEIPNKQDQHASFFIDFVTRNFSIVFSDSLKNDKFLKSRYDLNKILFDNLKSRNADSTIIETIDFVGKLFSNNSNPF